MMIFGVRELRNHGEISELKQFFCGGGVLFFPYGDLRNGIFTIWNLRSKITLYRNVNFSAKSMQILNVEVKNKQNFPLRGVQEERNIDLEIVFCEIAQNLWKIQKETLDKGAGLGLCTGDQRHRLYRRAKAPVWGLYDGQRHRLRLRTGAWGCVQVIRESDLGLRTGGQRHRFGACTARGTNLGHTVA